MMFNTECTQKGGDIFTGGPLDRVFVYMCVFVCVHVCERESADRSRGGSENQCAMCSSDMK